MLAEDNLLSVLLGLYRADKVDKIPAIFLANLTFPSYHGCAWHTLADRVEKCAVGIALHMVFAQIGWFRIQSCGPNPVTVARCAVTYGTSCLEQFGAAGN